VSSGPPVSQSPTAGRILVVRGGAIGDFILTLPVLAALRTNFPGNRLEVLGYPHITSLAVASGLVDAAKGIDSRPLAGFFARGGDLDFDLSAYFAGFHVILSYLFDPDTIFRTNLNRVSRAQFIQGPHRPDEAAAAHAAEQLLQPLQQLAVFDADATPRLPQPASASTGTYGLAVHPGSGSDRKNWPETNWRDLLRGLAQRTDLRFLLVGGEAEGGRLERLAALLPAGRADVLRSRPLPELAARLTACHGFLGHDSGITHLAAAVGLPGLILWGPSNVRVWRPYSERMTVLESGEQMSSLTVNRVHSAVLARFPDCFRPEFMPKA
jgi:heptosyltransferase-3